MSTPLNSSLTSSLTNLQTPEAIEPSSPESGSIIRVTPQGPSESKPVVLSSRPIHQPVLEGPGSMEKRVTFSDIWSFWTRFSSDGLDMHAVARNNVAVANTFRRIIKNLIQWNKKNIEVTYFVPYLLCFPPDQTVTHSYFHDSTFPVLAAGYDKPTKSFSFFELPEEAVGFYLFLDLLIQKKFFPEFVVGVGLLSVDASSFEPGHLISSHNLGRTIHRDYFRSILDKRAYGRLNMFYKGISMQVWPLPEEELLREYAPSKTQDS